MTQMLISPIPATDVHLRFLRLASPLTVESSDVSADSADGALALTLGFSEGFGAAAGGLGPKRS